MDMATVLRVEEAAAMVGVSVEEYVEVMEAMSMDDAVTEAPEN